MPGVLKGCRTDERLTEARPMSASVVWLLPDDDVRWNSGWLGRVGASECREPDRERMWPDVEKGTGPALFAAPAEELERLSADGG